MDLQCNSIELSHQVEDVFVCCSCWHCRVEGVAEVGRGCVCSGLEHHACVLLLLRGRGQ